MKTRKAIPRGIRNCNPLNIRIGNVWLGERNNPDDPNFEQFTSIEYGIRAAFVLLRRYINHYQRRTIEDIINAWAPSSENDTSRYIDTVANVSGISPKQQLSFTDSETMYKLVDAMIYVECGQHVPMQNIIKGYRMS